MAVSLYARRAPSQDGEVRYEISGEFDGEALCVLVIDARRPAVWRMEGGEPDRMSGSLIAIKALKRFRVTGEWPPRVGHIS